MSADKLYECPACGLHYRDPAKAKECEEWCRKHNSCNVEIIKFAEENKNG